MSLYGIAAQYQSITGGALSAAIYSGLAIVKKRPSIQKIIHSKVLSLNERKKLFNKCVSASEAIIRNNIYAGEPKRWRIIRRV